MSYGSSMSTKPAKRLDQMAILQFERTSSSCYVVEFESRNNSGHTPGILAAVVEAC
jgi:hypothetical protein